jgi:hypothetical protein
MAGQPNNMNNFNNQMQMNNNQYVYSMDNIKSDPFSLLNKIIGSIILDEHPHPLYSCFNIQKKKYSQYWTCGNCGNNYGFDIPSFICTHCDYSFCQNCLMQYPLYKIRLYDYSQKENFQVEINQNNFNFRGDLHSHYLSLIQMEDYNYSNKNSVIHCRKCKGNVKVTEAFYYCSLCNYYICTKCFDNSKPKPNFNSNKNTQFSPNNINNQAPQNNTHNMIFNNNFNCNNNNFNQMPNIANNNNNLNQNLNVNNQLNNNYNNNNANNLSNSIHNNNNNQINNNSNNNMNYQNNNNNGQISNSDKKMDEEYEKYMGGQRLNNQSESNKQ